MSSACDSASRIELRVMSDPGYLAPVRKAVEEYARKCGFDDKSVGEIGLVTNEALANVIRHAYSGTTGRPIILTGDFSAGVLRIALRDWGNGINPADIHPVEKNQPLRPGGLGLVCMRKLMDRIVFHPQPDGMVLEMTRALKGGNVEEKHG